jgi:hypothetical protein
VKPDDRNGHRPPGERPLRVLLISGSDRRQYNCPGVDSKSRALLLRMADRLPHALEIDYEDLGNVYGRAQIRSCNACVSTAMALCVWPCNCYEKDSRREPDLLWDLDLYARLDLADAWAFIAPVNWWGPTSNLKLLFDRLVCMNGGNPREDLIDHKDPERAIALEHTEMWQALSENHLEGRGAAFFCYGDGGADEVGSDGRPKLLHHKDWFDPERDDTPEGRDTYAPLVRQLRYSGIEVPDPLWQYAEFGSGRKYSDNQAEHMLREPALLDAFDAWTDAFADFVVRKGAVPPGRWRAFGYEPPAHRWADIKLAWRALALATGRAPRGSSPLAQDRAGLNRDRGLDWKKGEGERLRD